MVHTTLWLSAQIRIDDQGPWPHRTLPRFCGWAEPLAWISAPPIMQIGIWSTKIWMLVAVNPPHFSVSVWFSVVEPYRFPKWSPYGKTWGCLPGSVQQCWGSWMPTLGSLYAARKATGPKWPSWCSAGRGVMWSQPSCSPSPSHVVLFHLVVQRGTSSLPPSSGLFTMMSSLWIVASWSSCEGDCSWNNLCWHFDDITPEVVFFQRAFVWFLPVPWGHCHLFLYSRSFWIWNENSSEYHLWLKFSVSPLQLVPRLTQACFLVVSFYRKMCLLTLTLRIQSFAVLAL